MESLETNFKNQSPENLSKMNAEMYVIKRDGRREPVHFEKVQMRIKNKSNNLNVNPTLIAQRVCSRIYDGVSTEELDELAAQLCTSLSTEHPDYGILANRIIISNNHKTTSDTFKDAMIKLYTNKDKSGNSNPLISKKVYNLVKNYGDKIEELIDYQRDYLYDYFGFKTLQKGYLLKINGKVIERIQHMLMRVSLGLHGENLNDAFQSYDLMSQKYFTHATPTLFHSGTPNSQCLSCFLIGTEDSVNGMYKTIGDCAQISKWAGGIGVHISNIRSRGSYIRGSNGQSSGIIPLLRVYNATARHIDQAGKRKGSIAIYLEPWHPDVMDFLDIRKNNGNEEARARDLFTAMWIPDLFMNKVEHALKNPKDVIEWCFFDPDECKGLTDTYGDDFEKLYTYYEKNHMYRSKIDITKLWKKILGSQIETGTPYILFKDQINKHSNQKNIGTIKSSNLCVDGSTEVLTKNGYQEIKKLENKVVDIWNGFEFSEVLVKKTGENQEMDKIEFSNGEELICTPYHKFYIKDEHSEIRAEDLKIGMELIPYYFPVLDFEDKHLKFPYLHGLFNATGELLNKIKNINFEKVKKEFDFINSNYLTRPIEITNIIPIDYSLPSKLKYLEGVIDYHKSNKISGPKKFLLELKKLINTIGFDTIIDNDTIIIPNDLKNLNKIQITGIYKNFKKADTYCFNEEKRHFGVFNRILTGQCAEIAEVSNENEYACCCLGSISLSQFVEVPKITGKVKIYTKTGCPYCDKACDLLDNYEKIVLDDDKERKSFYNEMSGVECLDGECKLGTPKTFNGKRINTVPQIFIDDQHIGGYSDLKEYLKPKFNYSKLEDVCEILVRNLNRVIDINYYPVPETARGNFRHRPLGIGVQGFADALFKMKLSFESEETKEFNKKVFEIIEYCCLRASCKISIEREQLMKSQGFKEFRGDVLGEIGENEDLDLVRYDYKGEIFTLRELLHNQDKYLGAYSTFVGSPLSQGIFQFESMGLDIKDTYLKTKWNDLRHQIINHGIRNSLLTALMPTASTSQILGNNECFEPITSNIYTRRTLAGDFVIINNYLVRDLIDRNLWNKDIKDIIISQNGSVQKLNFLKDEEKELYKTVWEIKQKTLIDLSADRTPFISQTQSLNLFFEEPKNSNLGSALIYGWKRGLKTGSYYIRSRPKVQAQQFTIDPKLSEKINEVCESCSG